MLPIRVTPFNMLALSCLLTCLAVLAGGQIRDADEEGSSSKIPVSSPCPAAFTYDPREPGSTKWFGVILLTTTVKLVGFTLDIKLDRPADLLGVSKRSLVVTNGDDEDDDFYYIRIEKGGLVLADIVLVSNIINWQGDVETEDNTRFSITSTTKKVNPGPAVPLRIFVKHSNTVAPQIVSIKLNGRKICPGPGGALKPTTTTTTTTTTPRTTHKTTTARATTKPVVSLHAPTGSNSNRPVMTPTSTGGRNPTVQGGGNVECGKVHVQPQALITHGQGTERGQWPWHVAMYQNKGKDLSYICGGSLIGRKTVVTAAHCVTTRPSDRAVDPDTLVLYFGKYHLLLWSDGGVQNKQVQQVVVHPGYNSTTFKSDLAVLTLKSQVDYTEFVRPVCLWEANKISLDQVENKEGSVVGWGFDETGKVSQELMLAHMPVVSQQTCIWSYPEFFSHFTSNTTFCAGFRNGTSVCNGDSGGGMHFPIKQRDKTNTWYLRGLVSISPSKPEERVCDTRHYVVFTDLAQYLPWLNSQNK